MNCNLIDLSELVEINFCSKLDVEEIKQQLSLCNLKLCKDKEFYELVEYIHPHCKIIYEDYSNSNLEGRDDSDSINGRYHSILNKITINPISVTRTIHKEGIEQAVSKVRGIVTHEIIHFLQYKEGLFLYSLDIIPEISELSKDSIISKEKLNTLFKEGLERFERQLRKGEYKETSRIYEIPAFSLCNEPNLVNYICRNPVRKTKKDLTKEIDTQSLKDRLLSKHRSKLDRI